MTDELIREAEDDGLGVWHDVLGECTATLSSRFPEIEATVKLPMGIVCRSPDRELVSVSFQGEPVDPSELLERLVAARGGWSSDGDSSDEAVIATVDAYHQAWRVALDKTVVDGGCFFGLLNPGWPRPHAPKTTLIELDNGDRIACHAYFSSWDGGNHGTGYTYHVSACLISNGAAFEIPKPGQSSGGPKPLQPICPGGTFLR